MKKWFLVVKKMDGDEGVTQLENLNLARDEKFMESVSIEVSRALLSFISD